MVTAGAAGMETEASVFLIFLVQVSHRAIQRPLQVPKMMGSGGGEVWGPGRGCSFPLQVRALPGSAGLRTAGGGPGERESGEKGGVRAREPSHRPAPAATPSLKRNKAPTRWSLHAD